jgi:hypothetical protein
MVFFSLSLPWQALRHLQGLAQEASGDNPPQNAQQPAALRTLSHRLSRCVIWKPKEMRELKWEEIMNQASMTD